MQLPYLHSVTGARSRIVLLAACDAVRSGRLSGTPWSGSSLHGSSVPRPLPQDFESVCKHKSLIDPSEVDRLYLEWIYYGSDTDRCPCGIDHEKEVTPTKPKPTWVARVLKAFRAH